MKTPLLVFIRIFITVIFSSLTIFLQAQSWLPVGTGAACGQMAIDGSGNIYVLSVSGNAVYKYNGSTWTNMGDPYVGAGSSLVYYKYMTVSTAGIVYVTYHYGTATMPPTNIRSYTSVNSGSGFTLLGGADMFNDTETHYPCFDAVTQIGAVTDATTTNKFIKIRSFSGSWTTIGSIPISSGGILNNSAMDHDNSSNAYLIYYEGGYKLYKIASGSATQLGSTLTAPQFSSGSKIPFCISPAGDPYFGVIKSGAGGYSLSIYKYNGTTWDLTESDVISDPNGVTNVTNLTIDVSSTGVIYAGYKCTRSTGGDIAKVVYYSGTGTTWNEVGTQSFTTMNSVKISGSVLYKDGCEKYDVSAITTSNYNLPEASGISIVTDPSGIAIKSDKILSSITVYDFNGNLINNYSDNINADTKINLDHSGLYIVKVETSSGIYTEKVVFAK